MIFQHGKSPSQYEISFEIYTLNREEKITVSFLNSTSINLSSTNLESYSSNISNNNSSSPKMMQYLSETVSSYLPNSYFSSGQQKNDAQEPDKRSIDEDTNSEVETSQKSSTDDDVDASNSKSLLTGAIVTSSDERTPLLVGDGRGAELINNNGKHSNINDEEQEKELIAEFEDSALFNIDHPNHALHHKSGEYLYWRWCDKMSMSPQFRLRILLVVLIWLALLTPAVWLPHERLVCPASKRSSPEPNNTTFAPPTINSTFIISHQLTEHNESSFQLFSEDDDANYSPSNSSSTLAFCANSLDPDPLHWAAGLALVISAGLIIIAFVFSVLAERNACNYEHHAELCGVFPLIIFRTVMITAVLVAVFTQVMWLFLEAKRRHCPSDNADPCVLYCGGMLSFALGIGAAVFLFLCLLLSIPMSSEAVERNDLTRGIIKSVLEAGEPPEEDPAEHGSPYFASKHREIFVDRCECENCCCGADRGCCYSVARCLDRIKLSIEIWYHVDSRCSGCCCGCCKKACCCNNDSDNDFNSEAGTSPEKFVGFKLTRQNAFLLALIRGSSSAIGYFTLISVLILTQFGYKNPHVWSLDPPPDGLFTCNTLFPAAQELPFVRKHDDSILYRLSDNGNNEVMICTNISDFDPEIKKLPGILRTPNYVASDNPDCGYDDIREHCKSEDCAAAFLTPPVPFGVFWSYQFAPNIQALSENQRCAYDISLRAGVPNCTGTNILRVSGYGASLLGLSFTMLPLFFAVMVRIFVPLIIFFCCIRAQCGSVHGEGCFKDNRSYDERQRHARFSGRHKKTFLQSYVDDLPIINFISACIDPERFSEVPDAPRYRMMNISIQICEFFVAVFRVQPCWRWYQILYVSVQAVLLLKAIVDLYSDEVMIARKELGAESRAKDIARGLNVAEACITRIHAERSVRRMYSDEAQVDP